MKTRSWSTALYAAFFALFALPFATLYAACSHERVDTVSGYQTLAPHTYSYEAANGSTKAISIGTDGFGWIAIALVAIAVGVSLFGFRTLWLSVISVAAVTSLFLAVTAAGGPKASTKAELGYWLSSIAVALAPAAGVRPWRKAVLVGVATVVAALALIGALIGLVALTAHRE
ncbi:MAG TPA: hypothetical protein VJR46_12100 [Candidatus Dormibacteraeota bacterium]|nr:hypothetical protein [Candidatus Dormibacteraeota bacterium]